MTVLFTRKDYEALPEGTPVELCDGVLVKQPSPVFGHQRVQMQLLMALGRLRDPGRVVAGPIDVRVGPAAFAALQDTGIDHEVRIDNAQAAVDAERERLTTPPSEAPAWFDDFKDLDEIEAYVDLLAQTYPHWVAVETIGTSLEGRPIRAMRIDAMVALDTPGQPFAASHDPALRAQDVTFNGEVWPACQVELGTIAWFEALSDDLKASGLTVGKTLLPADILASFWLYGAAEPLPGAAPWYYGGLPGWAAADYLLVPLCPLSLGVRKLILDEVTETGAKLTEVRRNDFYVLFAKAPASP